MNIILNFISGQLVKFLTHDIKGCHSCTTNTDQALRRTLKPGDVLLVEGTTRVSSAIQYLTQSTWSHAALCVGPIEGHSEPDGEPHVLIEAVLGRGVVSSPLSSYGSAHTRICRPVGLTKQDLARLVEFAKDRIGYGYDLRNVVDLARYLLPNPPVPRRFRRKMLKLGSGSPTRAICSTLIAEAFEAIRYPVLPMVELLPETPGNESANEFRHEILYIRHHSLYAPRDFDISPYFQITKPTLENGFDFHNAIWGDNSSASESCLLPPGVPQLKKQNPT